MWLLKQQCVICKWGLLHSEHVNDANPGITGTFSRCNYITKYLGSPQPEILLRVNPVTFIIRPGGEASSELLWNDAELKSFVLQKKRVEINLRFSGSKNIKTLQDMCNKTYGCCLEHYTYPLDGKSNLIPVHSTTIIIYGGKSIKQ